MGRSFVAFWGVAGATTLALLAALFVPSARHLLRFGTPSLPALGATFAAIALAITAGAVAARRPAG